jgi:hypothetical protein
LSLFPQYSRYSSEQSQAANKTIIVLKNGLTLTELACFYWTAAVLTSTIIGATNRTIKGEYRYYWYYTFWRCFESGQYGVQAIIPDPAP